MTEVATADPIVADGTPLVWAIAAAFARGGGQSPQWRFIERLLL
jgi:hypothetical protein